MLVNAEAEKGAQSKNPDAIALAMRGWTLVHSSSLRPTTIAQLRKQQLSLADNSTWVAYNERLFEGLRKAGMAEE